ncbi:type II secretion system F family protein [Castellaniella sp.]|uniref:type II secretion system F family protein n=1 Tax=Castellaniella sp. TaxID=1955812 RepID=UPI003C781AB2
MFDAILIFLIGACAAVGAWLLLGRLLRLWQDYDRRLQDETRRTLDAAFLFVDAAQLRPLWWVAGAVVLLGAAWLAGRWWGIAPVLLGLVAVPPLVLRRMRHRRTRLFDEQLPELMQALAGALRAGAGLQPALRHIVPQSLPPLSQEFSLMLREQRLGLGFQEALQLLHRRMPTESCSLVVSALGIAAQTGGSLADTLERIAQTLRARQHWLGRVRALTAQGRMQSHIMAALPVCLLLVLARLEPDAMSLLYRTWYGGLVLVAMGVLEVLGMVWIRRVAAIDV